MIDYSLYYNKNEKILNDLAKNINLKNNVFLVTFLQNSNSDAKTLSSGSEIFLKDLPTKYKFTSTDVNKTHAVYLGEEILKKEFSRSQLDKLIKDEVFSRFFPSDKQKAENKLFKSVSDKTWKYYEVYSSEYSFERFLNEVLKFLSNISIDAKEFLHSIFNEILAYIRSFKITEPNRWRAKKRGKNLYWVDNPDYDPLFSIKTGGFGTAMDEWFTKIDNQITSFIGKPSNTIEKEQNEGIQKTIQFIYNLLKDFFSPIYKTIKPIITAKLEFDLQCANAFLIGAINAFVEFIAGFVEIIKLLISLFIPENFKKMVQGFKKMIEDCKNEGFFKYVSDIFSTLWKSYTAKYKDDGDVFEDIKDFTEDFGEIIVTLVLAFFSGGTSLLGLLKKIFKEIIDFAKSPQKIDEAIFLLKKAVQQTRTVLKNGGKIATENTKKAVQKVRMGYKMIEREVFLYTLSKGNVLRCTILPYEEFVRLFASALSIAVKRKLLKFGIEIAEHEGRYFMKYQGELFELGDKKAVKTKLKEIFDKSEDEVKKWLDDFVELTEKLRDVNAKLLKNKNVFNPNKLALKELGVKVPASITGLAPDFSSLKQFLYGNKTESSIVKIKLTGNRKFDFKLAYEKIGITDKKIMKEIDMKYTWHHLDDYNPITGESTFQLVEMKLHKKSCPHIGSVKQMEEVKSIKYE